MIVVMCTCSNTHALLVGTSVHKHIQYTCINKKNVLILYTANLNKLFERTSFSFFKYYSPRLVIHQIIISGPFF